MERLELLKGRILLPTSYIQGKRLKRKKKGGERGHLEKLMSDQGKICVNNMNTCRHLIKGERRGKTANAVRRILTHMWDKKKRKPQLAHCEATGVTAHHPEASRNRGRCNQSNSSIC